MWTVSRCTGVDSTALLPILNEHFLTEGQHALTADDLKIPSGWSYPCGEIVDEGRFLFVLLEEDTALQQEKSS